MYGGDFGAPGHLRGEIDYGNEGEKAAEEVDEIGDEVDIVAEDDALQGCFHLDEVVNLLHSIKHHHDDDNQRNGKEKRAEELASDVAINQLKSRPKALATFYVALFVIHINSQR